MTRSSTLKILPALLISLLLPGSFTCAALRETEGYKRRDFYPDTIAWNQSAAVVALEAYAKATTAKPAPAMSSCPNPFC
jgi:hypothetical protein